MVSYRKAAWLFTTTALGVALVGQPAWAQARAGGAQPLDEVVVTATRQNSTVNKVPLSITAATQRNLDQQGIKSIGDLARDVPAVTFRVVGLDQSPQIAVRGILSNLGAPTTGVYLDDVALQKRGINGAVAGNGTPIPALFDLDRVEVLRGPQGDLFGSGSEGGTIRFIQPTPSLTTRSSYARAEVSHTEQGGWSYEAGGATGGPIVVDKLGFRAAVFGRRTTGVLDHVSIYDGHTIAKDTDWGKKGSARLALEWQATPQLKVTPSVYYADDYVNDNSTWWSNVPAFTTNGGTFTNRVRVGEPASASNSTGYWLDFPNSTLPAYSFGPYNSFGPWKSPVASYYDQNCGSCTAYAPFGPSQITIAGQTVNGVVYPAQTINIPGQKTGPNSADMKDATSPRENKFFMPSLTFDYDFGSFTAKAITGYVYDETKGVSGGFFGQGTAVFPTSTTSATSVPGQFVNGAGANISGGVAGTVIYPIGIPPLPAAGTGATFIVLPGQPYEYSLLKFDNTRDQFTQEIRFSSTNNPGQKLTWVAGLYYERATTGMILDQPANFNTLTYYYRGIDNAFTNNGYDLVNGVPQAVGISCNPTPTGAAPNLTYTCQQTQASQTGVSYAHTIRSLKDSEKAIFGQANYLLTSKLKLTVGVRVSRLDNNYTQIQYGTANGSPFPPTFVPTPPTAANTAGNPYPTAANNYKNIFVGSQQATPVNPRVGVSYQANETSLFYATAAKGFRAGGVNVPVSPSNCAADLIGLGVASTPTTYNPDSVWSYEGGAKMRILGAQINASVFYIDWKQPQLTLNLACQSSFITNAGKAVSKGADIQAQRRFGGLTLTGSVSYDQAKYTQDVTFPSTTGVATFVVHNGDPLPIPKWQYNIAGQYDFRLMDKYGAYVRADYQYSSDYYRNLANARTYDPLTASAEATHFATARAGISFKTYDLSFYVNNLTNSQDLLAVSHATAAANVTNQSFRPREVGLQLIYRH